MRILLLMIAALGLTACTAAGPAPVERAAVPAASPAATEVRVADSPEAYSREWWDEVICRREPVTGTRLSRARCHSRYDWSRMQGAATETMRDIESQPRPCLDGAGCGPGG